MTDSPETIDAALAHDETLRRLTSTPQAQTLIDHARDLASDQGENTEYDRALVELTASVLNVLDFYADHSERVTEIVLGKTV